MIDSNFGDVDEFAEDLAEFSKVAVAFASRSALNTAAFDTQKETRQRIKGQMIERNAFTRQSIQVDKAQTLRIDAQEAFVGSVADYFPTQEFGGTKQKSGKHGVAIPTAEASGESVLPRQRNVRKANRLSNIRLRRRASGAVNRRQRNIELVQDAVAQGGKARFIYMKSTKAEGIYKVSGSKRRPKIRMVSDLSNPSVTIPKNATLKPAFDRTVRRFPEIYRAALTEQARRRGLFGR